MLEKATFLLSTFTDYPLLKDPRGNPLPELVLAGRSNVGKSSLINHFFKQKNLAKTSATPGKTQLLNFFLVDGKMILVDLPGYGFAKAPTEAVQEWSQAIDHYMNNRPTLKLILLLIDARREPNEDDLSLIRWAAHKGIPLLVILTKTDKLSAHEIEEQIRKAKTGLCAEAIPYTIMSNDSRRYLSKRIEEIVFKTEKPKNVVSPKVH